MSPPQSKFQLTRTPVKRIDNEMVSNNITHSARVLLIYCINMKGYLYVHTFDSDLMGSVEIRSKA